MSSPLPPTMNPVYPTYPAQQPQTALGNQSPSPRMEAMGLPQGGFPEISQLPPGITQDTFGQPPGAAATTPDMQALAQAMAQQPSAAPGGAPTAPQPGAPQGAAQAGNQAANGVYQHESGGFAEKNTTLSQGSSLGSIFSFKGLAIALGATIAAVAGHRVFTGNWIWSSAKNTVEHTWQALADKTQPLVERTKENLIDPINKHIEEKSEAGLDEFKQSIQNEIITPAKSLIGENAEHSSLVADLENDFTSLMEKASERIKTQEKPEALADSEFEDVKGSLTKLQDEAVKPQAAQEAKAAEDTIEKSAEEAESTESKAVTDSEATSKTDAEGTEGTTKGKPKPEESAAEQGDKSTKTDSKKEGSSRWGFSWGSKGTSKKPSEAVTPETKDSTQKAATDIEEEAESKSA